MADTSLFGRLKRLFSTDVIIRNVGGDQLRIIDTEKIQSLGVLHTNSLVDRFTKLYSTTGTGVFNLNNTLNYQSLRIQLYTDYEAMDTDSIIATTLDILADECTLKDEAGELLHIRSSDETIQKILYNLFYDVLNVEFNLWMWIRNMCKYGDFYLKLDITEKFGIYNVIPFSGYNIIREEGLDPKNPSYIRYRYDPSGLAGGTSGYASTLMANISQGQEITFENYEMAHFRLIADANFLPYGRCLASNSRIYTENSVKEIKDIKKGDKVWTYNIEQNKYELANVLNTLNSGIKTLYKVKTLNNEIQGSNNHPILIWDFEQNKPDYKQIKDLKIGDYLCTYKKIDFPLNNPKLNKNITVDETKRNQFLLDRKSLETFPEVVNSEFSRFWGFMLGDGWETKQTNAIGFAQGIKDNINKYYRNLLLKYSGKEKLHYITNTIENTDINAGVYVCSSLFHELMTINGYIGKSYSKRLPEWIYKCNEETQLSLVKGLMDADGYIFEDKWGCKSYNITLNNKELLYDIKTLLDRLKIKTGTIRPRKWTGKCNIKGVEYNCKQAYDFTFYLDGNRKKQYKKFDKINSEYEVEINKIKYITEELPEETYDIQVDKNSNFIADGIIVHNSYIEPARKIWKQVCLCEDAMLIHRLVRAPEKRIFYINVGGIPPAEVDGYMEKIITKMKKVPYMDPQTGQYNLKFNIQNMMEDFYIPMRGNDTTTKLDTAKALEYNGIDDVNYLRDRMFAALKVPKAFFGYEGDLQGKSTLAAEDIRFARTVERIQRIIISELTKIALIHLYVQGYEGETLTNFELSLTTPSIIYDQERVALMKEKIELAGQMLEKNLFPSDFIYDRLFHLSEDQYDEMRDLIVEDKKRLFRLTQIENEGNDPQESGESYGTPHDLATLYGVGRYESNSKEVPKGYDEKAPLGRPQEKTSIYNTQIDPLGKDRMGRAGMTEKPNNNPFKTNQTSLNLESKTSFNQNKYLFSNEVLGKKRKQIVLQESNLLDESQLRGI